MQQPRSGTLTTEPLECCASEARAPGTASCRRPVPSALDRLGSLVRQAAGTGIDTSIGVMFNHTLWGRDRSITALDVIGSRPELARQTVLALAERQGRERRFRSEEEPGRIHSEYRDLVRWQAPWLLKAAFRLAVSPLWGGGLRDYTTYFAADSTPLYVILVCRYASVDPAILHESVRRWGRPDVTVWDTVIAACEWLLSHMNGHGLICVPKRNPLSLPSQVWRDSPTSNLDEHNLMLAILGEVEYLDVQFLAHEAFVELSALIAGMESAAAAPPRLADRVQAAAERIRDATLSVFWMGEERYFAFARDRDAGGRPRLVRAVQSNAGWMLDSPMFDALPEADRRKYVEGIVLRLFADDMLTAAGIRGRSLQHAQPAFRNYHENVWPVDTLKIARGLRRQGLGELAGELERRMLNTLNALGAFYEFVVVDGQGRIVDPAARATGFGRDHRAMPLPSEMPPEVDIAWSVTGVLRSKAERGAGSRRGRQAAEQPGWVDELSSQVLSRISRTPEGRTSEDAARCAPPMSPCRLDLPTGIRRSTLLVLRQGVCGELPRHYARELRRSFSARWEESTPKRFSPPPEVPRHA